LADEEIDRGAASLPDEYLDGCGYCLPAESNQAADE
jgi:hypothetical protein